VPVRARCGDEWEWHLARRRGELQQHGEHHGDGAPKPSSLDSHQLAAQPVILNLRWRMNSCAGDRATQTARRRCGSSAPTAARHGHLWRLCRRQVGPASRWPGERRRVAQTPMFGTEHFVPGFIHTSRGTTQVPGLLCARCGAFAILSKRR